MDNTKHFCANCKKSFKSSRGTCGCKNPDIHQISYRLRVPKVSASKSKWRKFSQFVLGTYSDYYKFLEKDKK